MNNASKGRCVTVTPRGKARTKHLRQNPEFARGNIGAGSETENAFHKDHEDGLDREVGALAGVVFWTGLPICLEPS
jgi:hypothetical protein